MPALDDDDLPITDPNFYSSEVLCPDSLVTHIFRRARDSKEDIPLLQERIAIMRENGFILCQVRPVSFCAIPITHILLRHLVDPSPAC